ncbi:MAG: hypothetical protein WDN50_03610 [Bradyrhizobium sp.]
MPAPAISHPGLGLDLADVTANERIDARVAGILAMKHPGLDEVALVGKAFDSLFKQLCAEQSLLSPTGEQVLAPFAFVSNLAGALLALELARFESGARFPGRQELHVCEPMGFSSRLYAPRSPARPRSVNSAGRRRRQTLCPQFGPS